MTDPQRRRYPPAWERIVPLILGVIGVILLLLLGLAIAVALQLIGV